MKNKMNLKQRSFLLLEAFKTTKPTLIAFSYKSMRWRPIDYVRKEELLLVDLRGKYDRRAKGLTKKISSDDHIK